MWDDLGYLGIIELWLVCQLYVKPLKCDLCLRPSSLQLINQEAHLTFGSSAFLDIVFFWISLSVLVVARYRACSWGCIRACSYQTDSYLKEGLGGNHLMHQKLESTCLLEYTHSVISTILYLEDQVVFTLLAACIKGLTVNCVLLFLIFDQLACFWSTLAYLFSSLLFWSSYGTIICGTLFYNGCHCFFSSYDH